MGSDSLLCGLHATAAQIAQAHSDRHGLGWTICLQIPDTVRDVAISEHWSLPAWAISFYFVKFKRCVFSVLRFAEEATFLSRTRLKALSYHLGFAEFGFVGPGRVCVTPRLRVLVYKCR